MNRDLVIRWVRRAVVLAATAAVLSVGIMTVQVAADWRAASAPLDVAPVGMSTISKDVAAETDRTTTLSGQVDDVAAQISDLQGALVTANGAMSGQADSATVLQGQLDTAKTKLTTLQKQLKAAQARLTALNKAAARQAAINRAASARSTSSGGTSTKPASTRAPGGEPGDD